MLAFNLRCYGKAKDNKYFNQHTVFLQLNVFFNKYVGISGNASSMGIIDVTLKFAIIKIRSHLII
jgi:hypothetical protein